MSDYKSDSIISTDGEGRATASPKIGPLTPGLWGKELMRSVGKTDLTDSFKLANVYGPGRLIPVGEVGVSGRTILVDPTSSPKYVSDKDLHPSPLSLSDVMREACFETLLICLPHGYGFFPILPVEHIRNCTLAFGKLGCKNHVVVTVEAAMDLPAHTYDVLYHIKDGKTYSKSEIRLFALDIVNTINDLNGIDDSEQDDKGSD